MSNWIRFKTEAADEMILMVSTFLKFFFWLTQAHVDGHPNFYTTAVVAVAQKSGGKSLDRKNDSINLIIDN